MKDFFRLAFLPVVGISLVIASWLWARPDIMLIRQGEKVEGQVRAVLKIRQDDYNLIHSIRSDIRLQLGDGSMLSFKAEDYQRGPVQRIFPDGSRESVASMEPWEDAVRLVVREGVDEINRLLKREARIERRAAITGVYKREASSGLFGMSARPVDFRRSENELSAVIDTAGNTLRELEDKLVVSGSFGSLVPDSETGKDGTVSRYVLNVTLNDQPVDWFGEGAERDKDYILFQETYFGSIRPIVFFRYKGNEHVFLADLGKIREQLPAFKLFNPCKVAFLPDSPEAAIMLLHLDAIEHSTEWITWASAIAGAVFSRWMYPLMLFLIGATAFLGGLVFISLAVHPHPDEGFHRQGQKRRDY